MIGRWLCWIGWHKWRQDRPLTVHDAFPMSSTHQTPQRRCTRCHRIEYWLPGYGGSEIGSWENAKR